MAVAARAEGQPLRRIPRLSVASWVLYDLANTIFSLAIVSRYFSVWAIQEMGGTDQQYATANNISTLLMILAAPVLGALSDRASRRKPFLVVTTLLCVGFTLLLGTGGLWTSLALFAVANFFYQAGLIFYDSLLPEVSTEETRGRVGGMGVGVGYLGSIIAIGTGLLLLNARPGDYVGVFRVTALLFLVFSLPAFLFLRERPRPASPIGLHTLRQAFGEVAQTVRRARQYPGLGRFLIGRVFYADAANTLIVFMAIYVTSELGFSSGQADIVLLVGIVSAVIGGFVWGVAVDRMGPKRTLNIVLAVWAVVFALAMAIPLLGLPVALFWLAAALAGIALGGTWAADRSLMLRLSPPRYLGQFYGLYSIVGRFGSVMGLALWGFVVNTLGWGRPAAIGTLLVMVGIAYLILRGVTDELRPWSVDELEPE